MTKFKKHLLSFVIISFVLLLPLTTWAGITNTMIKNLSKVDLPAGGDNPEQKGLAIIGQLINVLLSLLGVIFLALVIFAGYKWLLARGQEEEIEKAKDILKSAVIGLVIVMFAFAISFFVTSRLQTVAGG